MPTNRLIFMMEIWKGVVFVCFYFIEPTMECQSSCEFYFGLGLSSNIPQLILPKLMGWIVQKIGGIGLFRCNYNHNKKEYYWYLLNVKSIH